MGQDIEVYLSALQDSLRKKWDVLQELLKQTKKQSELLAQKDFKMEDFDAVMDQKDDLIRQMKRLDDGFEAAYGHVAAALKQNPGSYKPQILELQNYIRSITDCSVQIQALEQKNKTVFEQFISDKREEIRNFNLKNKSAASYHQNMTNQHHEWQTYFLDKKK